MRNIFFGISFLLIFGCSIEFIGHKHSNFDIYENANNFYYKGDYNKALLLYKKLPENFILYPIALMRVIDIKYKDKKFEEVLKLLNKFYLITAKEGWFENFYLYMLFKTKYSSGDYEYLVKNSDYIFNFNEEMLKKELLFYLASAYFEERKYEKSGKIYEELIFSRVPSLVKKQLYDKFWILIKNGFYLPRKSAVFYFYYRNYPKYVKKILRNYDDFDANILYLRLISKRKFLHSIDWHNGIFVTYYIKRFSKNKNRSYKRFLRFKKMRYKSYLAYNYVKYSNDFNYFLLNYELFSKDEKVALYEYFFRFFIEKKKFYNLKVLLDKILEDNIVSNSILKAKYLFWKGYVEKYYMDNNDCEKYFEMALKEAPFSYYHIKATQFLEISLAQSIKKYNLYKKYKLRLEENNFEKYLLALEKARDYKAISMLQRFVSDYFFYENHLAFLNSYKRIGNYKYMILNARSVALKYGFNDKILRYLYPNKYYEFIKKLSDNPYEILALIHQESLFDKNAKSSAGALGLMQIMPSTARYVSNMEPKFLLDEKKNMKFGINYFYRMYAQFGRLDYALAAYNAGAHRVMRWKKEFGDRPSEEFIELIPFHETQRYVKNIILKESIYEMLYF